MKKLVLIFVVSLLWIHVKGQPDEKSPLTLIFKKSSSNEIAKAGINLIFKQYCTTKIDSIIRNGNLIVEKAHVGRILKCYYEQKIVNDTLKQVKVITKTKKHNIQLKEQMIEQFGVHEHREETKLSPIGQSITYTWAEEIFNGGKVSKKLYINGRKGLMIMEFNH